MQNFLGGRGSTFLSILEWQIVGQILSAILAPELSGVAQEFERLNPTQQLAVADVVEAIVKGHMVPGAASGTGNTPEDEAKLSGLSPERLKVLVDNAGEPIPLDMATEAWRRGFIPLASPDANAPSLEKAIKDSRLKNVWIGTVEAMQYRLPDPSVVIEGWLRAQIDPAAAYDYLAKAGIDKPTADLWYKSSGRPPAPGELVELYRRGVIPEAGEGGDTLSLRQGYLETDLKNKWYGKWLELARYVPPPRTVTAMVREGAMSDQRAVAFYKDAGLDEKTAAEYLDAAHHQRTAAAKELSKATVLKLYTDKLIPAAQATTFLEAEGYAADTVAYELEAADFAAEAKLIDAVLTRLRTLYVAHKLDKQATANALDSLGLDPAARDHQLSYWDQAAANNVAVLTPPQIASLNKLGWLDVPSAVGLLEGHGYSNTDAQLFLAEHLKLKPTDNLPAGFTIGG